MNTHETIEFVLTYHKDIEQAIYEKRLDPNVPKTGGSNGHSRVSDPTCQKALQNMAEVEAVEVFYGCKMSCRLTKPERWLEVARTTRLWFSDKLQGKLMDRKFKDVPERRKDICMELGIGTSLYSVMLNDIFCLASGIALGKGLIHAKEKSVRT